MADVFRILLGFGMVVDGGVLVIGPVLLPLLEWRERGEGSRFFVTTY